MKSKAPFSRARSVNWLPRVVKRADDDDLDLLAGRAQRVEHRQPVHLRHLEVEGQEVRLQFAHALQRETAVPTAPTTSTSGIPASVSAIAFRKRTASSTTRHAKAHWTLCACPSEGAVALSCCSTAVEVEQCDQAHRWFGRCPRRWRACTPWTFAGGTVTCSASTAMVSATWSTSRPTGSPCQSTINTRLSGPILDGAQLEAHREVDDRDDAAAEVADAHDEGGRVVDGRDAARPYDFLDVLRADAEGGVPEEERRDQRRVGLASRPVRSWPFPVRPMNRPTSVRSWPAMAVSSSALAFTRSPPCRRSRHRRVHGGDVLRDRPGHLGGLRHALVGLADTGGRLRDVRRHVAGHRGLLLDGRGDRRHQRADLAHDVR